MSQQSEADTELDYAGLWVLIVIFLMGFVVGWFAGQVV